MLIVCLSVCSTGTAEGLVMQRRQAVLRSYTDICDTMFMLEISLHFLAQTGGTPQGGLPSYLTGSLQINAQISSSVDKVESSVTKMQCKEC